MIDAIVPNPFRPGVGLRPPYLAGRDADIAEFSRVLDRAPGIPGNVRMTGLRGVGKTVLLQRFQELAESREWSTISVEIEPRHATDQAFRALVASKVDDLKRRISLRERVRSAAIELAEAARQALVIKYEGFEWSAAGDLDPITREMAVTLLDAVDAAVESGRNGVVLFFDEAQVLTDDRSAAGNHPLSTLIAAVSTLQKQSVPVALVLCGLPTLAVNLLTARTYTERVFRGFRIGSLGELDAKAAFTEPLDGTHIRATDELVTRVIDDVDGYPYFIQLWGAELWDTTIESGLATMTFETLRLIAARIQARLDLDFYEPRIESLTPAEQDLLQLSAACSYPPLVVSELNSTSDKSNENINVLLGRLVKANVLYRPRKGQYMYTAPKFRDYLRRRLDGDPIQ